VLDALSIMSNPAVSFTGDGNVSLRHPAALLCGCTVGVEMVHPVGSISDYEADIMNAMKPELLASIEKGIKFVKEN
jgi:hypothetical protein